MTSLGFKALRANQSKQHDVFTFTASVGEILKIAKIDRAGRDEHGNLKGFQRPQVARHIHEIRDYLEREDAVLPNSVVLAFVQGVSVSNVGNGIVNVEVDVQDDPVGYVVDGQQRLAALADSERLEFEVFVSAMVCKSYEELQRQFILINNSKPLPKELIYELLPQVEALPERLSSRAFAAKLTDLLNHGETSLQNQIKQHTNPDGVISSNAIQKVIMNSRTNGALRDIIVTGGTEEDCVALVSEFYAAVKDTFPDAWFGCTPKNSRLIHSAGIVALGYVMETAAALYGVKTRAGFRDILELLEGHTAWTEGVWMFGEDDHRPWNRVQNTSSDIRLLSDYLVGIIRRSLRDRPGPPRLRAV